MKETKFRSIQPKQAQSIIDIACGNWKDKLCRFWATNIVLNINIGISEDFYQEMRKACTAEQHKLFDTIFGSDKPKFKVGDIVKVTGLKGSSNVGSDYLHITDKPVICKVATICIQDSNWLDIRSLKDPDKRCAGHILNSAEFKVELATQDEINQVTWFEKSTLCIVSDNYDKILRWSVPNKYGYFFTGGNNFGNSTTRAKWIPCTPEQVEWFENLSK